MKIVSFLSDPRYLVDTHIKGWLELWFQQQDVVGARVVGTIQGTRSAESEVYSMSDISSINTSIANRVGRVAVDPSAIANRNAEDVRGRGGARTSDRVEISRVASYLNQLQAEPKERTDLINQVRSEIEAGTYLADDKLSAAADELLEDLNFEL